MSESIVWQDGRRVTIPKAIRHLLGWKGGERLTFTSRTDGTVVIRAKKKRARKSLDKQR